MATPAVAAVGIGSNPPINTSPPTITGTAEPGNQLSCSTGSWTNSPTSYAYQWKRDGVSIAGATSSTYTLTSSDLGVPITCTVTATNSDGSASATSTSVLPTGPAASPSAPTDGGKDPGGGQEALPTAADVIVTPSTKKCASKRSFKIHIRQAAGVTYTGATVSVNEKQVKTVKESKLTAPVNLTGLPKGRFSVKITVATSDGREITGTRKYKTCTRGTGKGKTPKL